MEEEIQVMIVDLHTHIFPPTVIANREEYCARDPWFAELYGNARARMATAEDLIASLDANGIEHAVTFGFGWSNVEYILPANDYVMEAVRAYPDRLTGLAVVQPAVGADRAAGELERCANLGLRGVGELMPHGQGYRLNDFSAMGPLLEVAAARDLLVLTHTSEPVGHRYAGKGDISLHRTPGYGDGVSIRAGRGGPLGRRIAVLRAHARNRRAAQELLVRFRRVTAPLYT